MKTFTTVFLCFVFCVYFNVQSYAITEHFTNEIDGSKTFSEGGLTFNVSGSYLHIENYPGWGYNLDNDYVDNSDFLLPTAGVFGAFTSSPRTFRVNDLYVFAGYSDYLVHSGDPNDKVIIRGKLSGITLFTYTLTGNNFNNTITNNYFTYVNLASYSGYEIDQLEFEAAGQVRYLAVDGFQFSLPSPTITSITPTHGPTTGGTSVTISGSNFTGATAVTFGGVAATSFSVVSATSITAATPAGTGLNKSVVVTTPSGSSSANGLFSYDPPTVASITPSNGPTTGGTSVTISGINFTGATAVTFGGVDATSFSVVSATSITATTPAGTGLNKSVVVTTPSGSSSANGLFTYDPPAVTSINPTHGPTTGGTSVTISGLNFTGATAVTFGGVAATSFSVVSATSITATTPAGTGLNKSVIVTTPSGSSSANGLFSYDPPAVTSINPTHGPTTGGTSVIISGINFTGATAVTFGGVAATSFSVVSATSITATTPAGTGLNKSVVVTTPSGSSSANGLFSYDPPVVVSIAPGNGPTVGGSSVTISGSNFTGATAVTFGGVAATSFSVVSATSITATTPAGTGLNKSVVVTTPSGSSSANSLFSYDPPIVASITPSNGPTTGGTSVTISGINFTGATAVTFGGVSASFTINSDSIITAISPASTAGQVDVTVISNGQTSNLSQFIYVQYYPVTVIFIGDGVGSINSTSPSSPTINCTGTSGSQCPPQSFNDGIVLSITASSDSSSSNYSIFMGWSSTPTMQGCNGVGDCVFTVDAASIVAATFTLDKLVNNERTSERFSSILAAYAVASSDDTIQIRDNTMLTKPFEEPLTVSRNLKLIGGYSPGFGAGTNTGKSIISGPLKVISGSLKVQNIYVR